MTMNEPVLSEEVLNAMGLQTSIWDLESFVMLSLMIMMIIFDLNSHKNEYFSNMDHHSLG